ncbi:NAD(P)H-hydrate dehydratase [Marinigracilibium pacificum]|uniref:Bifunctional NAD(P)H-hydrate repair enzyme n=1 Tax=Marinigracilibium pacificum TaxID=2729599 RepID=A0A848J284_9BACT|nr:NAD(P)H-hydrate dehydratase [Marinigracilibium pacificum]NMM49615.1 NAD(P)H-hydrate dehydratase [Marinigracilibium pacificum]
MIKILSAEQTREADQYTIKNEPINSIDLMERASTAFCEWFMGEFPGKSNIHIVTGKGNNGGDGLAIARMLNEHGYRVSLYLISEKGSEDFNKNYDRIAGKLNVHIWDGNPEFESGGILIDALFGSGLDRPIEGQYAEIVQAINNYEGLVVSVDMPSGVYADKPVDSENVVKASHTVSFQLPKLSFFMAENETYVGEWHYVDIGLNKSFIDHSKSFYHLVTLEDVRHCLKKPSKFAHKGNMGRIMIVGGAQGKMGAAVLSAKAALRSGAGLLTCYVPAGGLSIIQTAVPESMALVSSFLDYHVEEVSFDGLDAVGIGPGLGTEEQTALAFRKWIKQLTVPAVIDADGLNILSSDLSLLKDLPTGTILTPHPKEFSRLAGDSKNSFERIEKARQFAIDHKVVIVLKGAHTAVCDADGSVYFNSTGNPGMATGGSGDVLTGIITALLGQGYEPKKAAILAVFVHGLAGDEAAEDLGIISMIASDIVDYLPDAFRHIEIR